MDQDIRYHSHYGLTLNPFQSDSDPRFIWLGEKRLENLAYLKFGVEQNKGILLLTGDQGIGKSILVDCLTRIIDLEFIFAVLPHPDLSINDFFKFLARELGMDSVFSSKGDFLLLFTQFLDQAYSDNRQVLLIIDNSHKIEHELLEQIRLLSNIEKNGSKLLTILFVGRNKFIPILQEHQNRALRQRVVIRRHLEPFTDAETAEYIHHRLKIAGSVREPFNAEAVQEIQAFSGGYPSRINIICDHALKQGDASGLNTINGTAVRKCAKKLRKLQTKEGGKFFKENALHKDKKAGKNILPRRRAGLFITILIAVSLIALAIFNFMPEFKNNNPIRGKTVIQFAHNTSGLPLKAQEQLKRMATILDQYPDSKIKITGYTDSTGSYEYNIRISKIRAESVKTYFVKKGIDPSIIQVVGMGPQNPVAGNDTLEGRRKNRRVEVEMVADRH